MSWNSGGWQKRGHFRPKKKVGGDSVMGCSLVASSQLSRGEPEFGGGQKKRLLGAEKKSGSRFRDLLITGCFIQLSRVKYF